MAPLISNKLNNRLNELVGECFSINRMLDRGMSLLNVRWKLIRSEEVLHEQAAHAYLGEKFADGISAYQAHRDCETVYPSTPVGDTEYSSPLEFFMDYHNRNLSLESMIKDVVDEAIEEGDTTTKIFLDGVLSNLSDYTALSQTLVDLATNFGNDPFRLQMMDSVLKKYINV